MKIKGSNKGFTLVEVLVVLALITVLSTIGYPALMRQISHLRLKRDARSVMSELNAARLKAITQNTKYRVEFTVPDTYTLSVWSSGAWGDEATRPTMELSYGIDIRTPNSDFSIYFFPSGIATDVDSPASTSLSDICLSNTSVAGDEMKLDLENSTGKVSIEVGC